MKLKNEILNILTTKSKSELDEIKKAFDEIVERRSAVFSNTSELADQLGISKSLLAGFCRIYKMCRNNKKDFIEGMEKDNISPEWWYLIELFKARPIDELVALRREFYDAYDASLWDNMVYNETTDTWENYTGRSMTEIRKSICLSEKAFYIFRMHIKSGRWDIQNHIKKMESHNYKELFCNYLI